MKSSDDRSDASSLPRVAVIHLALKSYGSDALARFVGSYRAHSAGADHRLVIALKGFDDLTEAKPFTDLLGDVPHTVTLVPDFGLDIGTYIHLAREIDVDYLCFFNSRSVILADDWLAKLLMAVRHPGVGVSGATASLQGIASDMWRHQKKRSWPLLRRMKKVLLHRYRSRIYPLFPNPHVRTNAFLIGRDLFLSLDLPRVRRKSHAMRFESGLNGLTRQIVARGLRPVLVDRHGAVHECGEWADTTIFWRDDQRDLLVADNQTELFADADAEERERLTDHAWRPVC